MDMKGQGIERTYSGGSESENREWMKEKRERKWNENMKWTR